MNKTNIEYLDYTWNPTHGCTPASEGCDRCWARLMAHRLARMGAAGYDKEDPFRPTMTPECLDHPGRRKKPTRIGVSFMGDLFHDDIPRGYIKSVAGVFMDNPHHTFLVLTKRPERMREIVNSLQGFGPNVWLGVTAENQEQADKRISILLGTTATVRFVSVEPMLTEVRFHGCFLKGICMEHCESIMGMDCEPIEYCGTRDSGIDWVICGGESGPGARPMRPDWVRSIRDECIEANIPFMFKQWGEWLPFNQRQPGQISNSVSFKSNDFAWRVGKKTAGRLLDGKEYMALPNL